MTTVLIRFFTGTTQTTTQILIQKVLTNPSAWDIVWAWRI